jgi:hypothetical protein
MLRALLKEKKKKNPSGTFALLFSLEFRSVNDFTEHPINMTVPDVPLHTVCDFSRILTTDLAAIKIGVSLTSIPVKTADKQSIMLGCLVWIINCFFGLSCTSQRTLSRL